MGSCWPRHHSTSWPFAFEECWVLRHWSRKSPESVEDDAHRRDCACAHGLRVFLRWRIFPGHCRPYEFLLVRRWHTIEDTCRKDRPSLVDFKFKHRLPVPRRSPFTKPNRRDGPAEWNRGSNAGIPETGHVG